MVGRSKALAIVDRSHFGTPGWCKLCASSIEDQINEKLKLGWTAAQLQSWMRKYHDPEGNPITVDRRTIYAHKKHIESPQDRIVSYAQRARNAAKFEKPNSTPEEFLAAVTQVGMQRVIDDPSEVTIKDALAAAKAQLARPDKVTSLAIVFAQILNAPQAVRPLEITEGDYSEQP